MNENRDYTLDDHLFRDKDFYAQAKYDITVRWLKKYVTQKKVLLNIGCGGGHFNLQAEKALGSVIKGYEPEKEVFEQALKNCKSPNIQIFNQTLNEIILDQPADFIVIHDVLEHIKNDVEAVEKLHQLLSPGGAGVISVPAGEYLFGHHDVQLGHFRRYTKTSLVQVLSKYFEIEKMRYFGMSFIPIVMWYSVIKKKSYPTESASKGLAKNILELLCKSEAHVPAPTGTSLVALVRPKKSLNQ